MVEPGILFNWSASREKPFFPVCYVPIWRHWEISACVGGVPASLTGSLVKSQIASSDRRPRGRRMATWCGPLPYHRPLLRAEVNLDTLFHRRMYDVVADPLDPPLSSSLEEHSPGKPFPSRRRATRR